MKITCTPHLATLLLSLATLSAQADIHVVVAAASPLKNLSAKEALALYMGKSRTLPASDNAAAMVLDLPRDNPLRDAFYQTLTNMSPAQINSYWSRLMFTGQTLPPQSVSGEQQMAEAVRRNPVAIGYLSKEPPPGLRTVLVLKSPED